MNALSKYSNLVTVVILTSNIFVKRHYYASLPVLYILFCYGLISASIDICNLVTIYSYFLLFQEMLVKL